MSSRLYKADSAAAREAAYRGSANPFPDGSRRHRLYVKWRAHHDNMEDQFAEVAAYYGYPWPMPGMVRRYPQEKVQEAPGC